MIARFSFRSGSSVGTGGSFGAGRRPATRRRRPVAETAEGLDVEREEDWERRGRE